MIGRADIDLVDDRWRFFSQRMSITAATQQDAAAPSGWSRRAADSVIRPLVISSTMSAPTSALATEPCRRRG